MTTDMNAKFRSFRADLEAILETKKAAYLAAKAEYETALAKYDSVVKAFDGNAPQQAAEVVKVKGKPGRKPKVKVEAKAEPEKPSIKAKGKPGRKPKAEKAASVKAKGKPGRPKGKPGPKPAIKAKGKPGRKPKGNSRAAEGRAAVAQGLRPPIKEAIRQIMGDKVMNSAEVYEALKAKDWLPNANDPRTYIGYVLSASKTHFERDAKRGRGFYHVTGAAAPAADNGKGKKAAEKKAAEKKAVNDAILEEAGIGTGVFGQ